MVVYDFELKSVDVRGVEIFPFPFTKIKEPDLNETVWYYRSSLEGKVVIDRGLSTHEIGWKGNVLVKSYHFTTQNFFNLSKIFNKILIELSLFLRRIYDFSLCQNTHIFGSSLLDYLFFISSVLYFC